MAHTAALLLIIDHLPLQICEYPLTTSSMLGANNRSKKDFHDRGQDDNLFSGSKSIPAVKDTAGH